jgi:hypothetical protein
MSGPVILSYDSGTLNGAVIHAPGISVNGFSGIAALFIESFLDEEMFIILIGGKLNVKEKLCADRRVPKDKAKAASKYRAVCSKVKP